MIDEIYTELLTDHQTRKALESSEIWGIYSQAELARDKIRQKKGQEQKLEEENQIMLAVEEFRQKVANSPELTLFFKRVKNALKENPEIIDKVDRNFIMGIELLDLED